MSKWIVTVMLLVALLMVGCAKTKGVFDASMFMIVETQEDWKIVADKKTGVMYAVSAGWYNRGTFTLLVDADGKPMNIASICGTENGDDNDEQIH